MDDTRDERRMAENENFQEADNILTFIIAKNEGISLDEVDARVEETLRRANEEGIVRYVR